jgi:hypothetical protein
MYTNNPAMRRLIESGLVLTSPLRPRNQTDAPKIREELKKKRA